MVCHCEQQVSNRLQHSEGTVRILQVFIAIRGFPRNQLSLSGEYNEIEEILFKEQFLNNVQSVQKLHESIDRPIHV